MYPSFKGRPGSAHGAISRVMPPPKKQLACRSNPKKIEGTNLEGLQQPTWPEIVLPYIESVEHRNTEITLFIPFNGFGVTSRWFDVR